MKTEVKEIPFNGSTLLGIKDQSGQVWLAVRKVCLDIGLTEHQADRQRDNIKNDLALSKGYSNLSIPTNGGIQKVLCINEKFVTLWLAKISLTPSMQRKNPEAVEKLLKYQLEAAAVLHKAFYQTEEQKDTFHTKMGLSGQIEVMQVQINNMESMMEKQIEKLDSVMDNMTLTTVQQGKLHRAVKDRVNHLLGGAHSQDYKQNSRLYFINLWGEIKKRFNCGSRWQDLNPKFFNLAMDFISEWEYLDA